MSPENPNPNFAVELGRLVIVWNDIEHLLWEYALVLTAENPITAAILTAGLNVSGRIDAVRVLVNEREVSDSKILAKALEDPRYSEPWSQKSHQPLSPHVEHFLSYVDRLREYRNFYLHGIRSPESDGQFHAQSVSARARLSLHKQKIALEDICDLIEKVSICYDYGNKVLLCVARTFQYMRSAEATPPTWPERPPLPDRLQKPRQVLLGEILQPGSSRA